MLCPELQPRSSLCAHSLTLPLPSKGSKEAITDSPVLIAAPSLQVRLSFCTKHANKSECVRALLFSVLGF